ncbi:tryptophan-rich sensory protein [Devosia sp. J2-20]|jgi:hypothetical protein|uniref:tryptophan-rich sensory protein n=1 Tax=Devosia sp. J2-20 TaxID=3026161 RepID=UPI00249A0D6B|nr:tryptophan-rich sensory protein [Devosia sp. J2-20]WDQ99659.1 tryptophan-rich sensory protein [Devosia sp. J2-20]
MANTDTVSRPIQSTLDADRRDMLGLVLSGALPLSLFVIANGLAELNGIVPLFFAPFGLPGWFGAAVHIASLPLFGVARWMVADRGSDGRHAGWWLVGLMAGSITLPFLVTPLDSLMLSLVAMALLVTALSAILRVAKVSPKAALIMLPGVFWMGLSAFIGLSLLAGWAPPFGLTNHNGQAMQPN